MCQNGRKRAEREAYSPKERGEREATYPPGAGRLPTHRVQGGVYTTGCRKAYTTGCREEAYTTGCREEAVHHPGM